MKYIDPSYKILEQESGIDGLYKQIELAGRTCYKSEDKITEDSAKGFVDRMIESKHYAMLEHGTVYLRMPTSIPDGYDTTHGFEDYHDNKYSVCNIQYTEDGKVYACITTNLRVLVENGWMDDLYKYACNPTESHEKRITVRFTCNRQVSHEFVRHRVFSFAQESTRYCNYTKGKYGNELTFIEPTWSKKDKANHEQMTSALHYIETYYKYLIQGGWKPEQAATLLPNALKTELIMTGTVEDWKHFFDLRALGVTGKPHPQAQELALPLMNEFKEKGWIK